MTRRTPYALVLTSLAILIATMSGSVDAQRRGGRIPPSPPGHFAVRGHVIFVGGYFYDPHFGPYPWWGPDVYPHGYVPLYGARASLRVLATPKEAAVYVDGFYAGIVDDFDGIFQSLPLPPGGHEITLYEPGYRTVSQRVYLSPDSTFKWHQTMERLTAGAVSEPPPVRSPVPPPREGSVVPFRTPPRGQPGAQPRDPSGSRAEGYGSVALRVEPPSADVTVDGARWTTSEAGRFVIQLTVGSHRIEAVKPGYQRFSTEIDVREGQTTPLNVMLSKEHW